MVVFVKSAHSKCKVVLATSRRSRLHQVKRHNLSATSQLVSHNLYLYVRMVSHLYTHSLIQCAYLEGSCSRRKKSDEGEERHMLGVGLSLMFWSQSWHCIGNLLLRKFCWVFSSMRFPRIKCCVPCDYVSFSNPLYVVVLEMH